ncbi:putative Ulp1 protease family catalytic domain, papain-like cysteine peptidase superfamily [Helianthus annuus]|nr:putative Ulp1 protease family catalytic domain, papain-like cysteine peptidase superfamily [Helianthus annuus]
MSKRGKRGVASFKKNYKEEDYKVEFDRNNRPVGAMSSPFMSWFGLKVRQTFPYHIDTKNFERNRWEELWLDAKRLWNIQNDRPKKFMLRKAKKLCTKFRSRLVINYVHKGKRPFEKYAYLDPAHWDEFVKKKTSKEFLDISEKAKASANANTNFSRLGRTGFAGLDAKADTIWPLLEAKYPYLKTIQDKRAKSWIMSQKIKNPETNLYELAPDSHETIERLVRTEREMIEDGSYFAGNDDPIVRVMGREHGGRTRAVSEVIGSTHVYGGLFNSSKKRARNGNSLDANHERGSVSWVDKNSGGPNMSYAPIEKLTPCEMLFPYQLSDELTVAIGQIWPTSDRILHGKLISEGFVKVQVDNVIEGCEKMPVLELTKTVDIKCVGDMLHSFVQWPRDALKIVNKETSSRSVSALRTNPSLGSSSHTGASPQTQAGDIAAISCYHPEIEVDDPYEQEMPIQQNADQSFMNMLMQVQELPQHVYQQQMQATHAPNSGPAQRMQSTQAPNADLAFIDPEVTIALERTKTRPRAIQDMVELLSKCIGDNHSIQISSPTRMYPQTVRDSIPYVELLQLFSNDWLDITVIHWFAMYFYETHNSRCAFFNPHHIKGDSCMKNSEGVQEHIIDMFTFHIDKTFFVAPYLANNHWTLIIICPSTERGYIIDSISREKDQHSYLLTSIIDEAFGFQFLWNMVNCKQQKNGWECGFMVIKNMYEFVNTIQHDFPNKDVFRKKKLTN